MLERDYLRRGVLEFVGVFALIFVAAGGAAFASTPTDLALANGLVAFSGGLIAQYQGFADVTMGVGTLVAGMAAVILGETLKPRRARLGATIAMVAVGAVVFRLLIAVASRVGLDPVDLKLATAAFVLATLALPSVRLRLRQGGARK